MSDMILNETPVRTSVNFNINDIKLKDTDIQKYLNLKREFSNVTLEYDRKKVKVDNNLEDFTTEYGISNSLTNNINKFSNNKKNIVIDGVLDKAVNLTFKFDENNTTLINKIKIILKQGSKGTVILKYTSKEDIECFHNKILKVIAKKNSTLDVIILNFLNLNSINLMAIENEIEDNAKVNYTIIDFGGKNSITNYYSNLLGKESKNNLSTIYLGNSNQLFDLNYITHLRGEKSDVNIEVQGALKGESKKHFKGTIDFKKGAKKAVGNENDSCMLLSDTAKSLSLPMLLCSEENVEGNHASSAGRLDPKELFYIMSRGIEEKGAIKLMVRAKFNKILENINSENLRKEILNKIDEKLD